MSLGFWVCFVLFEILLLSEKGDHTIIGVFFYFTQHSALKIHPHCPTGQEFLLMAAE